MPFSLANKRLNKNEPKIGNDGCVTLKLTVRTEFSADADVFKATDALGCQSIDRNAICRVYSLFALGEEGLAGCVEIR